MTPQPEPNHSVFYLTHRRRRKERPYLPIHLHAVVRVVRGAKLSVVCLVVYHRLLSAVMSNAVATAHSFNKILNQPRVSKSRTHSDSDDGTKKLRRLILVEGIPSTTVPPTYY